MLKIKVLYFFLLVCFLSKSLLSQTPNYTTIGKNEFEGVDIYGITNHEGLLYVATNQGLFKQEYNTFVKLPFKNDQVNSLFDLTIHKDTLYCKSLAGNIYKLKNDSLTLHYQLSKKYFTDNFYFFFDKKDRIILVGDSIIRIEKTGNPTNLLHQLTGPSDTITHPYFSHKTKEGEIFISANLDSKFSFLYDDEKLSILQSQKDRVVTSGDKYLYQKGTTSYILCSSGDWYSTTNSKVSIKPKLFERYYLLNNNDLIGVGDKSGARILSVKNDTLIELKTFFEDQFISSVYQNNKGTIFLGTFGEGIIMIPNYAQTKIKTKHTITSIAKNGLKQPVISTVKGDILAYNDNELKLIDNVATKIDDVFFTKLPVGSDVQKQHNLLYSTPSFLLGSIKDICLGSDSLILLAEHNTISSITKSSDSYPLLLNNFKLEPNINANGAFYKRFYKKNRYYSITFDSLNHTIYAACPEGILNLLTDDYLKINNQNLKGNKLICYQDKLIVGTANKGVLFINKNQIIDSLSKLDGLFNNLIQDLKLHNNLLFIKSGKSIQVYNLFSKELYNLNTKHGLNNEVCIDFEIIDSVLWIATKKEFYNISLSSIIQNKNEQIFNVDSLIVNNKTVSLDQHNFSHNQNKFNFKLSYNDLLNKKDAWFTYKIHGFDQLYKKLSGDQHIISYDYIPAGNYRLEVKIHFNNQDSKPFIYSFSINSPFYQTWWFYLSLFLLTSVFFIFIYNKRIKQIQKKNNEKLEKEILSKNLLDSELKALRSQMNPHFIFNSLNSIQSLVLKQDVDKSYDYIAMFAELVRSTLNYSEQEFIPIDKELRFLTVYLDLEKLRFKDDFNYTINYNGPKLIQVPSILIQPFIENSLKHGLLHKKGSKILNITFEFSDKLICRITDNGVGRQLSNKIKKQNKNAHDSFSMNAINKRLEILSEQYQGEFYYSVIDLLEDEIPAGTEIVLTMPYKT